MSYDDATQIVVDSNGCILHVDAGVSRHLGKVEPWDGAKLSEWFSFSKNKTLSLETLEESAQNRQEHVLYLYNGPVLVLSVQKLFVFEGGELQLSDGKSFHISKQLPPPLRFIYLLTLRRLLDDPLGQRSFFETEQRRTIGAIIAGFAHEVRNPLAAIVSLTEGAIEPDMEGETIQALSRVPVLVERIENLIKVALSYGRPKAPVAQWQKIGTLISRSAEMLEQTDCMLPKEKIQIRYMDIPVFVDSEQIISVITNLLQNACEEAGSQHVELQIIEDPTLSEDFSLYRQGPFVALDVIDSGGGVPEDIKDEIFRPFFTTKSKGTGLGLALAKDLARLNNGELLLWKSSSQGSIFRLLLPRSSPSQGFQS